MACNVFRQAEDYRQRALETDSDKGKRCSHGPEHDLGEQRLENETASLNCENKKSVSCWRTATQNTHIFVLYSPYAHSV